MGRIDPDEMCPCGSGMPFRDCHLPRVKKDVPPEITEHVRLAVIPEPDPNSRAVFLREGDGTVVFQGYETGVSQDCGECGACLIAGVPIGAITGIVVRCNACRSFNEVALGGAFARD